MPMPVKSRKDTTPPNVERRDMPIMCREAPVTAVNVEDRSVQLSWGLGSRVRRYDWYRDRAYWEELSMDPAHVRMGRLQSGRAPLLDTHSRWTVEDVLGVVSSASLENGQGLATVRFSKREEVEPIFQDVRDKIICNVSVGYSVHRMQMIAPATEGDLWVYRADDWEPTEISLAPVGADPDAGTRTPEGGNPTKGQRSWSCEFVSPPAAAGSTREVSVMTEEERRAAEEAEAKRKQEEEAKRKADDQAKREADEKARREAATAENQRQQGIRDLARGVNVPTGFVDNLLRNVDTTVEQAGLALLREQARLSSENPTRSSSSVQGISDETETRRARMEHALALRANPRAVFSQEAREQREAVEGAREFRGMTLIDMAREAIEIQGGRARGLSRREIATIALNLDRDGATRAGMNSTSDFPLILGNTVNRTLRRAYTLAPNTFERFCRPSTSPDFKQIARVQLSESPAFQKVNEGGEYKYLQFGESAEKYALAKSGGIVALTWETLINDDLQAFDRIPQSLAAEARATEADIVYGILLNNPAMADGVALFHANHGNLPNAAAISEASLSAARALMRKQTGLKGRQLNLAPAFLMVGPDKELEANKFTSAQFVAAKASDINPNFNTSLEVVVDGRITGNKWFLSAEPGQVDTIEYSHLEGEEGLFTETRQGFEVDGLMIKVRHVFAAKAIDHRGLVYNSGA